MKMELRIALSNMKYYKNKNILIGIAIVLTSFLLFLVPTIGLDMMNSQFAAVNEIYPTWHALFRDVDEKTAYKLEHHHNVTEYGLRSDLGFIVDDNADTSLMYMDQSAMDLYRVSLEQGTMPKLANEIVVSKGMLKSLGIEASVGDTISLPYQVYEEGQLGYKKTKDFTISGMLADSKEAAEQKIFSAFVSKKFMEEEIPEDEIRYRFLFRIAAEQNTNTDQIKEKINDLANQFQIKEDNIRINDDYLMANYVDPSIRPAIIMIMAIIILAGIITIYSIYYVNIPERVQEFGRLKSIGATKVQIRKIVLLEGFGISCIAIPFGLLLGTILTKVILTGLFHIYSNDNALMSTIEALVRQGKISFFIPGIYFLAIVITLVTVYLSLLKPMSIAAKISEIDAMHYGHSQDSKKRNKKSSRKSSLNITIGGLSRIYLLGNKKNSMITILSMSMTGIFIMVIATVLSCANPRESANSSMIGQYQISIDVETGNKEHPEKEWDQIIFNNSLTDELKSQIENVDGVTSVSCFNAVRTQSDYFVDDVQSIGGIPREYKDELLDGIIE